MSHEVIDQVLVGLAMVALICLPFYWNYVLGLGDDCAADGRNRDRWRARPSTSSL